MKLKFLLDTSVYCQRLRPVPLQSVVERWKRLGDAALAISSICEAELRYGLERKGSERLWQEYHAFMEDRLVVLPIDKKVSEAFGQLKAEMQAKGEPRADFDLLIGATAIAHGLTLATLNVRHFDGLPGLLVEDWSRD